jgi:CheY-like chemotaxis protein
MSPGRRNDGKTLKGTQATGPLAARVGHEINNLLSYVLANLEFVAGELGELRREETLSPAAAARLGVCDEALRDTHDGARRIRAIAGDLLASPADEETAGPVEVVRAIDAAIDVAWNELRHRARLVRSCTALPAVIASEPRLVQVFTNLLLNAAHAMRSGWLEANQLRVTARADEGRVVVELADTGTGIPPEHLPLVFDPFFTTKPAGEGSGLGLPVSRELVRAMGGEIHARSVLGRGSVFRVELPASEPRPPAAASPEPGGGVPARRARVLVVDDEPRVASALRRLLVAEHDLVDTTSPGLALAMLEAGERFDAVLCDALLPGMRAEEFLEAVAARSPELASRVALIIGGTVTPDAQATLGRVPSRLLQKPFDLATVRALVAELTGARAG